jgi:hypothetical protein
VIKQLLDLVERLARLTERTAGLLEEAAPGLAQAGYWSPEERDTFNTATRVATGRRILATAETGESPSGLRWAAWGGWKVSPTPRAATAAGAASRASAGAC